MGRPSEKSYGAWKTGWSGWQFDEFAVRKDARDFAAEGLVQAVVVVGVEEAAAEQVAAQGQALLVGEADVAVPGHVEEGVVAQRRIGGTNRDLPVGGGDPGAFAHLGEEVGKRGGIGVPVAAAVVLEARDGDGAAALGMDRGCADGRHD